MQNNEFDNVKTNTMSINGLEILLEKDLKTNESEEKWNKIDKTVKYKKLMDYAENKEKDDIKLRDNLKNLLINSLNENKLIKISDVNYNNGEILSIPSLINNNGEYILKPIKRQLTSKALSIKSSKTKRNNKN
jgi:hypothetical protein